MLSLRLTAAVILASGLAIAPLGLGAHAAPLDKETCANLQIQKNKLFTQDIRAALERGPDWVKDHLDSGKIEQVREFLLIEEQLVFRCRGGGVPIPQPVKAEEMPLPDRNPNRPAATTTADAKPSQAVADSDKTAPSTTKATR